MHLYLPAPMKQMYSEGSDGASSAYLHAVSRALRVPGWKSRSMAANKSALS